MKTALVLILTAIIIVGNSCCTKVNCVCIELQINISVQDTTGADYYIIKTDKEFNALHSVKMIFSRNSEYKDYEYALMNETLMQGQLRDFNYIILNSKTNDRDTLREISYTATPTTMVCNRCFLIIERDTHCTQYSNVSYFFNNKQLGRQDTIHLFPN